MLKTCTQDYHNNLCADLDIALFAFIYTRVIGKKSIYPPILKPLQRTVQEVFFSLSLKSVVNTLTCFTIGTLESRIIVVTRSRSSIFFFAGGGERGREGGVGQTHY